MLNSVQKELKGSDTLLPVNYLTLVYVPCRGRDLLYNDCPKKMGTCSLLRFDYVIA